MNINGIKGKYLISLKEKNFKIMAKIPPIINVNTTIKKKKFKIKISYQSRFIGIHSYNSWG